VKETEKNAERRELFRLEPASLVIKNGTSAEEKQVAQLWQRDRAMHAAVQ